MWKKYMMLAAAGLASLSLWACTATRNSDGTITITFAPDMVITALGLEDALEQCIDLLEKCADGSFSRPCTQAERDDIQETIDKILETKKGVDSPPDPNGPPRR